VISHHLCLRRFLILKKSIVEYKVRINCTTNGVKKWIRFARIEILIVIKSINVTSIRCPTLEFIKENEYD